ncbi:protein argonaute 14-like [Penaeus monodon]|uniref:protein argonaute 14-like n=1 Tax=Penaeus monodon TaxID=6687 RepID=UPI0018A7122B|nr:protein argonaute 14-like [Penaeus monodon]
MPRVLPPGLPQASRQRTRFRMSDVAEDSWRQLGCPAGRSSRCWGDRQTERIFSGTVTAVGLRVPRGVRGGGGGAGRGTAGRGRRGGGSGGQARACPTSHSASRTGGVSVWWM